MNEFKETDVYPDIYEENKNNYKGGVPEMKLEYNTMYPDFYYVIDNFNHLDLFKSNDYVEQFDDMLDKIQTTMINDIKFLRNNGDYEAAERIIKMFTKTMLYRYGLYSFYNFDNFEIDYDDDDIHKNNKIIDKYKQIGYKLQEIENKLEKEVE